MYAISHQPYAYAAPPPPPRQYSNHGTSSAFSSSANPDEDWTKISDLAERRRIQNRIAQRNYRKKLKRRLEDLERRAGPSDGAPSPQEKQQATKSNKKAQSAPKPQKQQPHPPAQTIVAPTKPIPQTQFTPPMDHDELMFQTYDGRERSHTPPALFPYSTYPPPPADTGFLGPYGGAQQYRPMTTEVYPDYGLVAPTAPVTLPSMTHFNDAIKREGSFGDESMPSYSMNYGYMPGIEIHGPSPYDSNPHTPPLSHSFDHSANCSDSGYEYPTTPLSMPGSPDMVHQS